ncbi:hypothetical protein ABZV80_40995 [Streptomyces sp. NPDC005132]|uniref:hypothetical protein n=1 Tax=Streptomyces sp. NPDC005132 TaxID=3154294 RepID=UPI0033B9801C
MPVPILCHECRQGRYQVQGPDSYDCRVCGSLVTAAAFPLGDDERLVVLADILQALSVPEGHQVATPDRRCHAPHLGASLALALRFDETRPVYPPGTAGAAAELLATLDADERGPWVLSPAHLDALTRAMDVRYAALPSASRQYPEFDAEIRNAHARSRAHRT